MSFQLGFTFLAGLYCLSAAIAGAQEAPTLEKLEREVRQLKLENLNLNKSLAMALVREETKTKILKKIREDHALLGIDILEGGDSKLLHAVTDYQIARENLAQLEEASSALLPLVRNYLRSALGSDPDARKAVETKIRDVELALGQRRNPKRKIEQGTAQQARVVTVDSNTGALVVNAGSDAELTIGTNFRIERSGSFIGEAIVAATRPNVSGLLIQALSNPDIPVEAGDIAKVITLNTDPSN